jgi:hypothetical protein
MAALSGLKMKNKIAPPVMVKVWEGNQNQRVYVKFTESNAACLHMLNNWRCKFIEGRQNCRATTKKSFSLLANLIAIHVLEVHFTDDQVFYGLKQIGDFDIR